MKTKPASTSFRVKKAVRGPGRPQRDQNMETTILDVAERLFAEKGYTATSMREVADGARVNQALITYYFGSKDGLFEATFKRRAGQVIEARQVLLDELLSAQTPPTVEQLVRAYVEPQFDLKKSGDAGIAFVRIQARLHNEPEQLAFQLRRAVYDPSAKRYIAALCKALPDIPAADVNFRMMFMIGTYLYMLGDVARLDEISDGAFNTTDIDEVMERMVTFLTYGISAPPTPVRGIGSRRRGGPSQ